jgi:quinol monooxygenase YgiN
MITIKASMTAKSGKRDVALSAFKSAMAGSQSEGGCIAYLFTIDIVDPDIFHVLEIWDGESSLLAHLGGEAFSKFMAVAGDIVDPIGMCAWSGLSEPYQLPF